MRADREKLRTIRGRSVLVTEIQALERLAQRTPRSDPSWAALQRRLGAGYLELEAAALQGGDDPRNREIATAAARRAVEAYTQLQGP